jgi:hypothetical protein
VGDAVEDLDLGLLEDRAVLLATENLLRFGHLLHDEQGLLLDLWVRVAPFRRK